MKKVLIIGGSGYLGSYLQGFLQDKGLYVRNYDIMGPCRHDFVFGDICDTDKVIKAAEECSTIVILSGVVGDRECAKNPGLADQVNHKAVANICAKLGDRHIIFMSTCAVYGAQDVMLHENSPVNPLSIYASTKLDGEKHVISVGGTIFRLGSVYGVGSPYRIRLDSIVNYLTLMAFTEHKFSVFGYGQYKCFISVKDVAGYIYEAINKEIQGLFNIATQNYTLQAITDEILRHIDAGVDVFGPLPNDRNYRVDMRKMANTFEYHCEHPLCLEIDELLKLYKDNKYV
jgi:nucleoside-diphosphate-sugar epimerase